jgi:hypothetical protein
VFLCHAAIFFRGKIRRISQSTINARIARARFGAKILALRFFAAIVCESLSKIFRVVSLKRDARGE